MLARDSGKLIFLTIRDRSDEIQLFVSKSVIGDEGFANVKSLTLVMGGVTGDVMTTRRANSVRVTECQLLSKAVRPLPTNGMVSQTSTPVSDGGRRPHRER